MAVHGDILFYRHDQVDLDDALRHQIEKLREQVDKLPEGLFSHKTDSEIATEVANAHSITGLTLDMTSAKANVREAPVEVRDHFERAMVRVPGLIATKSIKFTGDKELWTFRPNPWGMNPPHGEVRGDTITIGLSVPAQQSDQAVKYMDDTLAQIAENIQRQSAQIERHNASIAAHALPWIKARRDRLGQASDLLKKLGG